MPRTPQQHLSLEELRGILVTMGVTVFKVQVTNGQLYAAIPLRDDPTAYRGPSWLDDIHLPIFGRRTRARLEPAGAAAAETQEHLSDPAAAGQAAGDQDQSAILHQIAAIERMVDTLRTSVVH